MKKLILCLIVTLTLAACNSHGNTGNPPADSPDITDQGAAIKDGDTSSGKPRDQDSGRDYREPSNYPK